MSFSKGRLGTTACACAPVSPRRSLNRRRAAAGREPARHPSPALRERAPMKTLTRASESRVINPNPKGGGRGALMTITSAGLAKLTLLDRWCTSSKLLPADFRICWISFNLTSPSNFKTSSPLIHYKPPLGALNGLPSKSPFAPGPLLCGRDQFSLRPLIPHYWPHSRLVWQVPLVPRKHSLSPECYLDTPFTTLTRRSYA